MRIEKRNRGGPVFPVRSCSVSCRPGRIILPLARGIPSPPCGPFLCPIPPFRRPFPGAMKKTGPATSFRFLAPAFALLPAALLPGERPTPLQDLGGAIMRIGVWWIHRR